MRRDASRGTVFPRGVKRLLHAALALCAGALFAPGAGSAEDSGRLGFAVVPTAERIVMRIDPDSANYSGSVRIDLDVREPVSEFSFHAEEMTLRSITLEGPGGAAAVTPTYGEKGLVSLRTNAALVPGPHVLSIDFENDLGTKAVGLYRMDTGGHGYVYSQFEAADAREAFPCWDEPSFKIPWSVTLDVPSDREAVFNTPEDSVAGAGARKTIHYARTRPLPSYLLAFAIGPFEMVPIRGLRVPGRVVTPAGQSGLAHLAAETTPPILAAMERYFGIPYPFEKLDLIAVPEFWPGAMENPGAITFADRILLLDAKTASARERRGLASVTAHELAHMWFGDLVTMAWWDDLWLNESFADWMGDKITDEVFPQYQVGVSEVESVNQIMDQDARPSAEPIRQPVVSTDEMMQNVRLAYNKGKTVLGMFETWIGPDVFQKGVNDYLNAHAWGNAVAADLWNALAAASGKEVDRIMPAFLEQPGFPLVTIAPLGGSEIQVSQERFANEGVAIPPLSWSVPVVLTYSDGRDVLTKSFLLEEASQTVKLPSAGPIAWILPNAGAAGYYRWRVPPAMMAELAARAPTIMTPRERVAFLGNLKSLLDAGEIGGEDYLEVVSRFAADSDPHVVSQLLTSLGEVEEVFVPEDQVAPFAAYVRAIIGPALEHYGFTPRAGEEETVALLRPELITTMGTRGLDPATRAWGDQAARAYLADPAAVDAGLVRAALAVAADGGDRELFDAYRERFEAAKAPTERSRLLDALARFRDPEIRQAALDYALAGPLRTNEITSIPRTIARRPGGEDLVFAWVTRNFDALAKRLTPEFKNNLPFYAGGCSLERLAAAERFFAEPGHSGPGTAISLARIGDSVHDCVRLREREGAEVARYLAGFGGGAAGSAARH